MDNRPVGFFDSGVGGLTIFRAVSSLLPHEELAYIADSAHFPYGALPADKLCDLTTRLTSFLLSKDVKLIVVACNTATVHTLAYLRGRFPLVPFVGVVPVVKTLAERSKSGVIGLLSTPNTARSPYLADLVDKFALGMRVVNVSCEGLADLVELGKVQDRDLDGLLLDYLDPILSSGADVLGLGCTHYPFLRDRIETILAGRMQVFDASAPVALRVRAVLAEKAGFGHHAAPSHALYTTGDESRFASVIRTLCGAPLGHVAPASIHFALDEVE